MRGEQLARQWKIIRLLESRKHGITANEIAVELATPLRTVYRDLDAIQAGGFPLYTDKEGRHAYWRVMDGFMSRLPLPFTSTELMALHMSRHLLRVFDGTVFQESIESFFEKLRASLSPETVQYLENLSQGITVGFGSVKNYETFKEIASQVSDATAKRRSLEIVYGAASTGEETRRKVDPYHLWAMNGAFYLIGRCHMRNDVRTFSLDRIKSLSVLSESFECLHDFSLEDYCQTAFRVMTGDPEVVKVRFAPTAAYVVKERIWHPTQEISDAPDGGVVITLEVPINFEIVSWILGFGSTAEVLEPESLRERISQELDAAAMRYRENALASD